MEVEAKFGIPEEETFRRLLELDSLAGLHLSPISRVDVGDRYFDTSDGDLWTAGVACRVRREGLCFAGTIKGLGNAEGAIHRRLEHEVALEQPVLPLDWPPGKPREMVELLSNGKPLQPLFDLEQERHRRVAHDGDAAVARAVAEISLDRVRVRYGEATIDRYLEVEAELLADGTLEELERLSDHLANEWGLAPEPRSKFERALGLVHPAWAAREESPARGSAGTGIASPTPAPARRAISPHDLMSEAGRKTLNQQFQKMIANEPGTRLGADPEALHDMRVATRRMRAAFRVFGDYYKRKEVAGYEKALRRTGRALGPVRDLDVFVEKVQAYVDTLAPEVQGSLDGLLLTLRQKREAARAKMIDYLDDDRYARFKQEFAQFCETEGMACRPIATDVVEIEPHRVRDVAPVAIYERLAIVRAYDERVRSGTATLEQLHALRIACKRLRYTLEFFQQVLGADVKTVIQEIVQVQDHLGAIQDVVVARELLQSMLEEGCPNPGIEQYLNYREAELEQLLETLPNAWTRLNSREFDKMLARLVVSN